MSHATRGVIEPASKKLRSETAIVAGLAKATLGAKQPIDWEAYADAVGIARGVAVQPSVYGLDNSALLSALQARPERLRGVVVIDPATPAAELRRLHGLGRPRVGCRVESQGRDGCISDVEM